ncbi:MAG: hypothetical protein ACI4KF_06040 [Huintestinicola sp.]
MFRLYSKDSVTRSMTAMQRTGRFAHTYILTGDKGAGKKTAARYIAMQLLCDNKNACGTCRQCRRILMGQHPDVIIPDKDKKSKIYTVDIVREMVADCFTAPNDCDRKIYILPDCEGWKDASQDALLKITEEPPDSVYFIFTAENRSFFLQTLISRSMVIDIPEASREDCIRCLSEAGKYDEESILDAAENFGGNIGRCIAYLEGDKELCKAAELVRSISQDIVRGDEYSLAVHLNDAASSRDEMRRTLEMLARVIRDSCVMRAGGRVLIGCCRQDSVAMSERIGSERLMHMYEAVCRASERCLQNVNTAACAAALCGSIMRSPL